MRPPKELGGIKLATHLEVTIPSQPRETALELAEAAYRMCPYSNATRGNIDIEVTLSDD
jgi:organic hydroperoxide reductase OsmC/OhrA